LERKKIAFLGAGNMARAIMNGICASAVKNNFKIYAYDINPAAVKFAVKKFGASALVSCAEAADKCSIIVLAVKPQNFPEVMASLKNKITKKHLIISIAAGISIPKIGSYLGSKPSVARVMPNTPALVGEGAAGYSFSAGVKAADKKITKKILSTFCKVSVLLPENKINTVTALSGSGPAYVFYFVEAMLEAAAKLNLDAAAAKLLIVQTFKGSAKLLAKSGETAADLRKKVTSKGGTTESAISVLDSLNVKEALIQAVIAAKERGDELGK
jgi:pyrroline-5-carboxylate reductase